MTRSSKAISSRRWRRASIPASRACASSLSAILTRSTATTTPTTASWSSSTGHAKHRKPACMVAVPMEARCLNASGWTSTRRHRDSCRNGPKRPEIKHIRVISIVSNAGAWLGFRKRGQFGHFRPFDSVAVITHQSLALPSWLAPLSLVCLPIGGRWTWRTQSPSAVSI